LRTDKAAELPLQIIGVGHERLTCAGAHIPRIARRGCEALFLPRIGEPWVRQKIRISQRGKKGKEILSLLRRQNISSPLLRCSGAETNWAANRTPRLLRRTRRTPGPSTRLPRQKSSDCGSDRRQRQLRHTALPGGL
jgi:hypothetical protein